MEYLQGAIASVAGRASPKKEDSKQIYKTIAKEFEIFEKEKGVASFVEARSKGTGLVVDCFKKHFNHITKEQLDRYVLDPNHPEYSSDVLGHPQKITQYQRKHQKEKIAVEVEGIIAVSVSCCSLAVC